MDFDPTSLSDEDLDTLVTASLAEQERRRVPAMVATIAAAYTAGGGDLADLTAAITASQTPEEPTP